MAGVTLAERAVDRIRRALAGPRMPGAIVAVALVLASPCLVAGLIADDYIHVLRLSPERSFPGFPYAPLDLFTFASGEESQRRILMEEGLFAWWTAEDLQL